MTERVAVVAAMAIAFGAAGRVLAQSSDAAARQKEKAAAAKMDRALDGLGPQIGREVGDAVREAVAEVASLSRWAVGAMQDRDFRAEQVARETRTLSLGANGVLELKNISGDISVTAGGGRDIRIDITRRSRGRTDADAKLGLDRVTVSVDQRAERATVEARYPDERRPSYSVSVSYVVTAPAGTRVTATSIDGAITIRGIQGDVAASVISGSIDLGHVGRVSSAKTISGNVTVADAASDGSLDVGSVSGTVTLQQIKARRVSASVISGNVTLRESACDNVTLHSMSGTVEYGGTVARSGRYELQSHSGTVRFMPSGSVGFELQASTFSGDVRTDIPLQIQGPVAGRGPRKAVRGTFGDGSAVVILTTFSGNVFVGRQ